jgi:general transcription factor 3C polypeptide 3 (transcription factor C subunit 4)
VKAFQRLVKHDPESGNNFTLLHEFYPLIIQTNQLAFGQSAYRNAFDYHYETFAGPSHLSDDRDENDASDDEEDEGNTMALEHVMALVDILTLTEKLEEAVEIVRKGQRWLQGRVEQKYWDTFEDDREYALEGEEGHDLDIGLRHRLALLRLRLGNDEEAFVSSLFGSELTNRGILGRYSSWTWWHIWICLWSWDKH